jgi:hypothetical protein
MKQLTNKQQIRVRAKVGKTLQLMGFTCHPDGYYWRVIPNQPNRYLCMGCNVPDSLQPGTKTGGWCWRVSESYDKPLFGLSGSLHRGSQWTDFSEVINETLKQFHEAGYSLGSKLNNEYWQRKIEKIREIIK